MSVRRASLRDCEALLPLLRETDALHADLQPGYFRLPKDPGGNTAWEKILGSRDEAIFVAEKDTMLVGFVHAQIFDTPSRPTVTRGRRAYVDHLVVTHACRRQGLGKKLMQAASEWAREQTAAEILLTVWAGNAAAEAFYASLGFREVNRVLGRPL